MVITRFYTKAPRQPNWAVFAVFARPTVGMAVTARGTTPEVTPLCGRAVLGDKSAASGLNYGAFRVGDRMEAGL